MRPLKLALLMLLLAARLGAAETAYLFTYFIGNGEDGLHLAWSDDGYRWEVLGGGRSFLTPTVGAKEKLMRDPCATRGPDGTYHLVWTSGWWERGIGHASTRDFVTWSAQEEIPVMAAEPTARNSWAPEVLWDATKGEYLIHWATTIPGRFPDEAGASEDALNHRIYCTTTKDWRSFTPTRLFIDPGFNVIDATIIATPDGYRLVVKDETKFPVPKKHLRSAHAASPTGPWKDIGPAISRDWVEGPTVIQVGSDWLVYYDVYREKHFGALRTGDWVHWEDVTGQIRVPPGARHGTMLAVPRAVIDALKALPPAH